MEPRLKLNVRQLFSAPQMFLSSLVAWNDSLSDVLCRRQVALGQLARLVPVDRLAPLDRKALLVSSDHKAVRASRAPSDFPDRPALPVSSEALDCQASPVRTFDSVTRRNRQ